MHGWSFLFSWWGDCPPTLTSATPTLWLAIPIFDGFWSFSASKWSCWPWAIPTMIGIIFLSFQILKRVIFTMLALKPSSNITVWPTNFSKESPCPILYLIIRNIYFYLDKAKFVTSHLSTFSQKLVKPMFATRIVHEQLQAAADRHRSAELSAAAHKAVQRPTRPVSTECQHAAEVLLGELDLFVSISLTRARPQTACRTPGSTH